MENKQLKDGVGNLFSQRMRDKSAAGDGSLMQSIHLYTPYPLDYGAGGMYAHTAISGTIAAGMAAAAPVFSFHWPANLSALIRRVRFSAWSVTAFTAGFMQVQMKIARAFTARDTGGTAHDVAATCKMRGSMGSSLAHSDIAATAALTPGTRTLDSLALEDRVIEVPATATKLLTPTPLVLFERQLPGDHPLMLVQNEGFVIAATVPATGTWGFSVSTEWDEVAIF